jgi:hypothetical protein
MRGRQRGLKIAGRARTGSAARALERLVKTLLVLAHPRRASLTGAVAEAFAAAIALSAAF